MCCVYTKWLKEKCLIILCMLNGAKHMHWWCTYIRCKIQLCHEPEMRINPEINQNVHNHLTKVITNLNIEEQISARVTFLLYLSVSF